MNREPTTTVTVRVSQAIAEQFQARARELRRSRSSLAAEAIEVFVRGTKPIILSEADFDVGVRKL